MWEDVKPLMAEFFKLGINALQLFWVAIKWLAEWIAAAAVWLYEIVVIYCRLVYGLFPDHLWGVGAMVIVLVVGYVVVNGLQKKKSFTYIPWYKEPSRQAFFLVPIVTSFLAVATNPSMVDVSWGGNFFIKLFHNSPLLGPAGHLGVPTTIWALVFSFIFVGIAAAIALQKEERRQRKIVVAFDRRKKTEVEAEPLPAEQIESGEESVILNEQPGWYEESKRQAQDREKAEQQS